MDDDELYELAKERIANDNGKRYSQDEIMEEFEIDEDDDFYEEKPFDWTFIEFLLTWDDFKKAYDKLLERVKEIDASTYDLQVYNAIYIEPTSEKQMIVCMKQSMMNTTFAILLNSSKR